MARFRKATVVPVTVDGTVIEMFGNQAEVVNMNEVTTEGQEPITNTEISAPEPAVVVPEASVVTDAATMAVNTEPVTDEAGTESIVSVEQVAESIEETALANPVEHVVVPFPVMAAHPAADLFPMLPKDELRALADDIGKRGQVDPVIVILDVVTGTELVLDGRNRVAACRLAGVEPRTIPWDGTGGSPLGFVLAKNLHRRHMTAGQRAAVAVDMLPLLEMEAKERQKLAAIATNTKLSADGEPVVAPRPAAVAAGRARDIAAAAVGASGRSVSRVKQIKEADLAIAEAIKAGLVTIPEATRLIGIVDPVERRQALAEKSTGTKEAKKPSKKLEPV